MGGALAPARPGLTLVLFSLQQLAFQPRRGSPDGLARSL